MNPTALLKIIAALIPLMGNKEIGESMVAEIQAIFVAMKTSAEALEQIHVELRSINQKLIAIGAPLGNLDVQQLQIGDYNRVVADAIALGVTHNDDAR